MSQRIAHLRNANQPLVYLPIYFEVALENKVVGDNVSEIIEVMHTYARCDFLRRVPHPKSGLRKYLGLETC